MRMLALGVLTLAACHGTPHAQPDAAAPAPDGTAQVTTCTSAAGTAHVTVSDGATTHVFTRLDAGATWEVGPVAVASAPVTLSLLVIDADPIDQNTALCCAAADHACCALDGVTATTGSLASGAELGTHAIMLTRLGAPSFALPGTLTITQFTQPFDAAPGRITGSISATDGTRTIDGTLDNTFCPALLTATL